MPSFICLGSVSVVGKGNMHLTTGRVPPTKKRGDSRKNFNNFPIILHVELEFMDIVKFDIFFNSGVKLFL